MVARQLSNELDALPGDFVLVLDDYSVIQDASIHELVATCLRRPPRPLHLVLATRQDPLLPLVKLRAAGSITELRLQHLRFGPAESATFLGKLSGLDLDKEGAAALDRAVEGWPAGLRLASLSLRSSANLETAVSAIANSRGNIMDYLFSEILANLPETHLEWLLKIAIPDQFCGQLCAALCAPVEGGENPFAGESFLEWLQSANLFLVPLDDKGIWFRFHHLFLQLLRYRQAALYDHTMLADLHRRAAAAWFAGAGWYEDALRHAFAAGDLVRAVAIVRQASGSSWSIRKTGRVCGAGELFPGRVHRPDTWVVARKSVGAPQPIRIAEIDGLLDRIEAKLQASGADSDAVDAGLMAVDIAFLRSPKGGLLLAVGGSALSVASQHPLPTSPESNRRPSASTMLRRRRSANAAPHLGRCRPDGKRRSRNSRLCTFALGWGFKPRHWP
ncbi:MAG: hypothetical protein IPK16_29100 [Anaerolineales bacterium]|nr:hypothetical protein [Anaerolineales bacterium]